MPQISRCVPKPNHLSLVSVFETSRLDGHARVGFCPTLSFMSIQSSDHSALISHRRVVIVNYYGNTLIDSYVKPTLPVSHHRTNVTGIEPQDLESGERGMLIPPRSHISNLNPLVFP